MRFFNTAGPVRADDHYCVPPLERIDLADVLRLIDQKKYFVLHSPRQTGKTSCLLALMEHLNHTGDYVALYTNVENAQAARENVEEAMRAILYKLGSMSRDIIDDPFIAENWRQIFDETGAFGALEGVLSSWAKQCSRRIVLLLDEVDALVGDTLISVLRQLRSGYTQRPELFPQSVVLCGVRDVRDYRIHSTREKEIITGGSTFNIKAKSLRVGDFSRAETEALYLQHTAETGQRFAQDALDSLWELTQGQPWLVNALGYEVAFEMEPGKDRQLVITAAMIGDAKENLILRRDTHLDQLADKLQEERVRKVIEPIISGSEIRDKIPVDDIDYVRDLGLITVEGQIQIANPIYREIVPRQLIYTTQVTIAQQPTWYVGPDGRLQTTKLLKAFQVFFREHSEHWLERFQYKEAGPQLLLQASLQRIINSGGRIDREYGLGRMRTDLLILWPVDTTHQKVVVELKLVHRTLERTIRQGLEQTWQYMDRCGAAEAHLIIFDRTEGRPWEEKVFRKETDYRGQRIVVWGM